MSAVQELYEYQNEVSALGDLSRELIGIENDFLAGSLSVEDKNELIKEVIEIKAANSLADQENALRMIYAAGSALAAVV